MRTRPVAMTIAGSDSGGGAGLQADLKTFTSLGVFGTTVVTALTAQNTVGVYRSMEVPLEVVEAQFDAIVMDFQVKFAKTGMLPVPKVIDLVKKKVKDYGITLVFDPVMVSKTGYPLLDQEAREHLRQLLKSSLITTPNLFEAEILSGVKVSTKEELKRAAMEIHRSSGVNVVAKGGSTLGGTDVVVIDGEAMELTEEGISTKNLHGSGDVFSAAITAYLAKGYDLKTAVRSAKSFSTFAIKHSLDLGKGVGPVDPFSAVEWKAQREEVREELESILGELEKGGKLINLLSPEDKINLGGKTDYGDVASLAGGIIKYVNWTKIDGPILFNLDNLVSEVLRRVDKRYGISLPLTPKLLAWTEKRGIVVSGESLSGDLVLVKGKAVLLGRSGSELMKLIEEISK